MDYLEIATARDPWHANAGKPFPLDDVWDGVPVAGHPDDTRPGVSDAYRLRAEKEPKRAPSIAGMMTESLLDSLTGPSKKEAPRREPEPEPRYVGGPVRSDVSGAAMAVLIATAIVACVGLGFWAYHRNKLNKLRAAE